MQAIEKMAGKRSELRDEVARLKFVLTTKRRQADEQIVAIENEVSKQCSPKEIRWQRAAIVFETKAKRKTLAYHYYNWYTAEDKM